MTTLVVITTYNRPEYLAELIDAIRAPGRTIHVHDDGSLPRIKPPAVDRYRRYNHHGRTQYYRIVQRIVDRARVQSWDRLLMIPDDVLPARSAFVRMERTLQEITRLDPSAVALNPLVDRRGHIRQWGGPVPVRVRASAWLTGWADCCFYGGANLHSALGDVSLGPPPDHVYGSGVGGQLSRQLRESGNLYQMHDTAWLHRDGPSVMCPAERLANPL